MSNISDGTWRNNSADQNKLMDMEVLDRAGLEIHAPRYSYTPRAVRIDTVSSTLFFLGRARVGTAGSAAEWQIQKITTTPEGDLTSEWADGDTNYDNVWDNHTFLSYT